MNFATCLISFPNSCLRTPLHKTPVSCGAAGFELNKIRMLRLPPKAEAFILGGNAVRPMRLEEKRHGGHETAADKCCQRVS